MSSSIVQPCSDLSDIVSLYEPAGLFLKPIARLHISVHLPLLKVSGKSVSNWEVMEKLKALAHPYTFTVIKVSKTTLEFIRFEAEIESKVNLPILISRFDQHRIKISGIPEALKLKACEAKPSFPTKHDWDSFFRDAKNMNEMKPGERPDTIYIANLPCRWFLSSSHSKASNPSEEIVRKVFEQYGELRLVDIPLADPYRNKMDPSISGLRTCTFGQDGLFEAYVQFQEYVGFVKAMSALKGMKILHKEESKTWTASVKVDFDRTKHLTDLSIKKRSLAREKLMEEERDQERQRRKQRELEELKREDERRRVETARQEDEHRAAEKKRLAERKLKEKVERKHEKRAQKKLDMARLKIEKKVALEERKLLLTQRNLESMRLLEHLLEQVRVLRQKEVALEKEQELLRELDHIQQKKTKQELRKAEKEALQKAENEHKEKELRSKLTRKYRELEEKRMEEQRERLRSTVETQAIKLKSVLSQVQKHEQPKELSDPELSLSDLTPHQSPELRRTIKRCSRSTSGSRSNSRTSRPRSNHRDPVKRRLADPLINDHESNLAREEWSSTEGENSSSHKRMREAPRGKDDRDCKLRSFDNRDSRIRSKTDVQNNRLVEFEEKRVSRRRHE